ncbi:MAG: diacylglycerol kinase family protein [Bacteroidota bacterium]
MLRKRIDSFKYAFTGLADLYNTQPNVWIHTTITVLVIFAGFFFAISITEWCIIVLAIATVLSAEAFNTAIEHLTDLVSPDHHQLAGKTKDVAAAAVLIMAIGAAIVGLLIFLPYVRAYFQV